MQGAYIACPYQTVIKGTQHHPVIDKPCKHRQLETTQ
jgi:hypothetical protein